eukprot:COSAG02_NODE_60679_length_270_cov_1.210526_1_plen_70_part_01
MHAVQTRPNNRFNEAQHGCTGLAQFCRGTQRAAERIAWIDNAQVARGVFTVSSTRAGAHPRDDNRVLLWF